MTKKKRVVLGEGHPWFFSSTKSGLYDSVQLTEKPVAASILLRGGEKVFAINLGNLGNWNKIRLVAEVIE